MHQQQSLEQNNVSNPQQKGSIQAKHKSVQAKQHSIQAKHKPIQAKQRPIQAKQKPIQAKQRPVQRSTAGRPQGSAKFQEIATTMGQQHGVDTTQLKATHNSPFPDTVNAEATIQGNKIDFAPGKDTEANIKHEVAHAIDNAKNGTPKGDKTVNGQNVDTTREQVVDNMAAQPLQLKQGENTSLSELSNNAEPIQRIINTKVKGVIIGRRAVYDHNGAQAGFLPSGTIITIADNTQQMRIGRKNKNVYHILSLGSKLKRARRGVDLNNLYIVEGGIRENENRQPDSLNADAGSSNVNIVGTADDCNACWNWALTGTVPGASVSKSTAMFSYVSSQVPESVGGFDMHAQMLELEGREATDEEIYNMATGELSPQEKAQFDNFKDDLDAIVQTLRNARNGQLPARRNATKEATRQIMIKTIESYGMRVLPLNTPNTWKICMHERIDKIGYEHWWIKDPNGLLVETFPDLHERQYVGSGANEADNEQEHRSAEGTGADRRYVAMNVFRIPVADLTPMHYQKMRADGKLA
ncbi:MAG TPA: hypothetical protein DCS93_12205 [Microscillaceae bacterium]|nr:hypothetical protein [Microscillaceae bacterium]